MAFPSRKTVFWLGSTSQGPNEKLGVNVAPFRGSIHLFSRNYSEMSLAFAGEICKTTLRAITEIPPESHLSPMTFRRPNGY